MTMAIAVLGAFSVVLKAFGGSPGFRLLPLGRFVVFGNYDFQTVSTHGAFNQFPAGVRGVREL